MCMDPRGAGSRGMRSANRGAFRDRLAGTRCLRASISSGHPSQTDPALRYRSAAGHAKTPRAGQGPSAPPRVPPPPILPAHDQPLHRCGSRGRSSSVRSRHCLRLRSGVRAWPSPGASSRALRSSRPPWPSCRSASSRCQRSRRGGQCVPRQHPPTTAHARARRSPCLRAQDGPA